MFLAIIQCSPHNSNPHIYHEFSDISKIICVPTYIQYKIFERNALHNSKRK